MERKEYSGVTGIYTKLCISIYRETCNDINFQRYLSTVRGVWHSIGFYFSEAEIQYFFKNYMIKTFAGLGFY